MPTGVYVRSEEHRKKISEAQRGEKNHNFGKHLRGELTPRWKGGRLNHLGYILVFMPDHSRADSQGYVREHILVWEKVHGRPVPEGYVVHHINRNRSDNRIENLLCLFKPEHDRLHRKAARQREALDKPVASQHSVDRGGFLF